MRELIDIVINRGKPKVMALTTEGWRQSQGLSAKRGGARNHRPDLDECQSLMEQMHRDGHSLVSIGQQFNASPSTVARRLGKRAK